MRNLRQTYVQKKTQDPFKQSVLWKLVEACDELNWNTGDLRRTDPKQMELQNEQCDE